MTNQVTLDAVREGGGPLFAQIVEQLQAAILAGSLAEEAQAPSTNELASFHRINPATAAKALSQLAADGVLYKKRGIGMFVSPGARTRLLDRRRAEFQRTYVEPMVHEAGRLGLSATEIRKMIAECEARS